MLTLTLRTSLLPGLLTLLTVVACRPPTVQVPTGQPWTLPVQPVVYPLPEELNLFHLDAAPLRALIKDPEALDRGELLDRLADKNPGLRAVLDHCGLDARTQIERVILGLLPFDRLNEGAVALVQGSFDASRLVGCLGEGRAGPGFTAAAVARYPAVRTTYKGREVLVLALARGALVAAVARGVPIVTDVLRGARPGMSSRDQHLHLGPRTGTRPVLTVSIRRIMESRLSMLASAPLFLVRLLREAELSVTLPGEGRLVVEGHLRARGPFAARRLWRRWKVLSALLGAFSPEAKLLLGAVSLRWRWRDLPLRFSARAEHQAAFLRLVKKLAGKLGKRKHPAPEPRR
jgi:hypothetical protein